MEKLVRLCLFIACLQAAIFIASAGRPDFVTDEIMEMLAADKQRCMTEHGTTEAMIDAVGNGQFENNRAVTCYMFCLFETFSLMDEDGNLEVDMLIGFLPESVKDAATSVIGACADKPASDACEKMYVIGKCIYEQRPDLWFMV